MLTITIDKNTVQEIKGEWGGVYGEVWRRKGERRKAVIKIQSQN